MLFWHLFLYTGGSRKQEENKMNQANIGVLMGVSIAEILAGIAVIGAKNIRK